jgi:hypothetical protein
LGHSHRIRNQKANLGTFSQQIEYRSLQNPEMELATDLPMAKIGCPGPISGRCSDATFRLSLPPSVYAPLACFYQTGFWPEEFPQIKN